MSSADRFSKYGLMFIVLICYLRLLLQPFQMNVTEYIILNELYLHDINICHWLLLYRLDPIV